MSGKINFLIRKPDFDFHARAGPAPVEFFRVPENNFPEKIFSEKRKLFSGKWFRNSTDFPHSQETIFRISGCQRKNHQRVIKWSRVIIRKWSIDQQQIFNLTVLNSFAWFWACVVLALRYFGLRSFGRVVLARVVLGCTQNLELNYLLFCAFRLYWNKKWVHQQDTAKNEKRQLHQWKVHLVLPEKVFYCHVIFLVLLSFFNSSSKSIWTTFNRSICTKASRYTCSQLWRGGAVRSSGKKCNKKASRNWYFWWWN